MKVFISADIEGTAGITNWDEARKPHADYPEHRQQMTREVLAACDGANAAGAKEILIKDAHATGRNILQADLPENVRLIRGWSGHPMSMVQELDKSFDAALFIGYHSKAGDETNPLAHTLTGEVMRMRINGVPASEFLLHAYAAATVGVPVVFVSGDWQLCTDIKETNPNITAVAVSEGIGPSTVSLAPKAACAQIREGVKQAGVKRLLTVGGAASLYVAPGVQLFDTPAFQEHVPAFVIPGARAARDELNRLRSETALEWSFLSPPANLFDGERRGAYRLGEENLLMDGDKPAGISQRDLAIAIVDEIETPRHVRKRFTVAY